MKKVDQKRAPKPDTCSQVSKKQDPKISADLSDDELEKVSGGGKVSLSDFSFRRLVGSAACIARVR